MDRGFWLICICGIVLFFLILFPARTQTNTALMAVKANHEFVLLYKDWADRINAHTMQELQLSIDYKDRELWQEVKKKMHKFEKAQDAYYNGTN